MFSTLSTLSSAVCSLFSYEALSYSVPQLPNATTSIFPAIILFILLISSSGLIALQMRRFMVRNCCASASVVDEVEMSSIDGNNLNQKGGKPPENVKCYTSARVMSIKSRHPPASVPFAFLSDHQKDRRRIYSHVESDDTDRFSLKEIAIENNFNQMLRKNSNGSIKELPAVQPRSPLAIEHCNKLDLIRKAGRSIKPNEKIETFNFSLINA